MFHFRGKTFEEHVEAAAQATAGVFRSRYGMWALALISFAESALVVPIITDPFLVAHILANKQSAFRATVVTVAASVLGGIFAYVLAAAFFDIIVMPYFGGIIGTQFYDIAATFKNNTFIFSLAGALTPIPYTIAAMVVGFVHGSLLMFILASIIGRGARYAIVGVLTHKYGERALRLAQRKLRLVTILCIAGIALYVAVHFLS